MSFLCTPNFLKRFNIATALLLNSLLLTFLARGDNVGVKTPVLPLLDPRLSLLINLENLGNNVHLGSPEPFALQFYEVPERLINFKWSQDLPDSIRSSLSFKKNGETWIRWVINPSDTQWHLKIQDLLKRNGLDTRINTSDLIGYNTASRSIIVVDPKHQTYFSVKVSTNNPPGLWKKNKDLPAKHLRDMSASVDLLKKSGNHLQFLGEPLLLGIDDSVHQGMAVRDLTPLFKNSEHIFIPGFSALHDTFAYQVALANGAKNTNHFWRDHYAKTLGRAMAEHLALSQAELVSTHSQNFLLELDSKFRPTGNFIGRDFADSTTIQKSLLEASGRLHLMSPNTEIQNGKSIKIVIGFMNGNHSPSWNEQFFSDWNDIFKNSFVRRLSELTSIKQSTIARSLTRIEFEGGGGNNYGFQFEPESSFYNEFHEFVRCISSTVPLSSHCEKRKSHFLSSLQKKSQTFSDIIEHQSSTKNWSAQFKTNPELTLRQLLREKLNRWPASSPSIDALVIEFSKQVNPKTSFEVLELLVSLGTQDPAILTRIINTSKKPETLLTALNNVRLSKSTSTRLQLAIAKLNSKQIEITRAIISTLNELPLHHPEVLSSIFDWTELYQENLSRVRDACDLLAKAAEKGLPNDLRILIQNKYLKANYATKPFFSKILTKDPSSFNFLKKLINLQKDPEISLEALKTLSLTDLNPQQAKILHDLLENEPLLLKDNRPMNIRLYRKHIDQLESNIRRAIKFPLNCLKSAIASKISPAQ